MQIEDGNLILPITINGVSADDILDSDAAISLLSASEAKRLGLTFRYIGTKMEGMSGAGVSARIAVSYAKLATGPTQTTPSRASMLPACVTANGLGHIGGDQ